MALNEKRRVSRFVVVGAILVIVRRWETARFVRRTADRGTMLRALPFGNKGLADKPAWATRPPYRFFFCKKNELKKRRPAL